MLRARAAKNPNSQDGLLADFLRVAAPFRDSLGSFADKAGHWYVSPNDKLALQCRRYGKQRAGNASLSGQRTMSLVFRSMVAISPPKIRLGEHRTVDQRSTLGVINAARRGLGELL